MTDILPSIVPQRIKKINSEPTTQSWHYVYSIEYQNYYLIGKEGNWSMPPKNYKMIWGWIDGLVAGGHI